MRDSPEGSTTCESTSSAGFFSILGPGKDKETSKGAKIRTRDRSQAAFLQQEVHRNFVLTPVEDDLDSGQGEETFREEDVCNP